MKILVTGAVGQVGRFLIRKLIHENIPCVGLDKRDYLSFPEITVIHPEITTKEEIEKHRDILKDVDVLVHLASLITKDKDVIKSGIPSVNLNVNGTINLLEFLPNLEKICYSSTYMVYGTPIHNPVKEDHPTNPNIVYGASKLATEKYLQIFAKQQNIKLSILRFMGIYNIEKPHGQAIPTFVKKIASDQQPIIFGDGKIRRNHLEINDAIDSIMKTINNPINGVFNIGGPDSPSNLELIEIINNELGKSIEPIFRNDTVGYDFITDIIKARNEMQFVPKIGIKEGLKRTIQMFQEKGW